LSAILTSMRAHLVQLDIAWEDPATNFQRVETLVSRAGVQPGELVVLPEMFDTGFSLNVEKTADHGDTLAFLAGLARRLKITLHGSRTVMEGARARNRATILGPDGATRCEFSKIHPFSYGREPERFDGGREVVTYLWDSGPAGRLVAAPAVCYDLRFPELFRLGLLKGAESFVVGANWPAVRQHHWRTLLVARAVENQAFVLGVNRTGSDPNVAYAGGSIAIGPRGDVLGELGAEQAVLTVDVDPREVSSWRTKFPAWCDMKLIALPAGE
jgi:omega-amidase